MYIPATFREARLDALHALMRSHPLGLLVTAGPDGCERLPTPTTTGSWPIWWSAA